MPVCVCKHIAWVLALSIWSHFLGGYLMLGFCLILQLSINLVFGADTSLINVKSINVRLIERRTKEICAILVDVL